MSELNIIGDIAGNFATLQALLKKMPEGETISVGDMIDRGPSSKEVVDFLMKNGKAVLGNHEHMMIDWIESVNVSRRGVYDDGIWAMNGGLATMKSYDPNEQKNGHKTISDEHIAWMRSLPRYIEKDDLIITHAPINPIFGMAKLLTLPPEHNEGLCWNRGNIKRIPGKFQVYGHQGLQHVKWHTDKEGQFGICIDTCNFNWREGHKGMMTGIHWPSKKLYQQEIID
ncbi:MAG: metallophosphoesterase [Thermodesulfobacteriota bacterium]